MKWFWLAWFAVFLAGEAYGLAYGGTLSQVWRDLRDQLPAWLALTMSVATFGTVTWLFIHWAFSYWDRTGLDLVEKAFITVGAVVGALSFVGSRKQNNQKEDGSA